MTIRELKYKEKTIRIKDVNGNPWFVMRDLCNILEFKNYTDQLGKLNKSGVEKIYLIDKLNRKQKTYIIDEPNMYRLIMSSKIKTAKDFQDHVYNVILPQIRKTGKYVDSTEKSIRLKSAKKRNVFTSTLKDHGIKKPHEYIQLTYETKIGLDIDKKKKKSECDLVEVLKIGLAEDLATLTMIQDDPEGFDEIKPIVKTSAKTINKITKRKELTCE